jgi:hypothetical protein
MTTAAEWLIQAATLTTDEKDEIAAAVLAAAAMTPISADVKKVNDTTVTGAGTESDPWGP